MTRRNFFRSALACFGAMVLAPVRAVEPRVPLIGNWDGKVLHWRGQIGTNPKAWFEATIRVVDLKTMDHCFIGFMEDGQIERWSPPV